MDTYFLLGDAGSGPLSSFKFSIVYVHRLHPLAAVLGTCLDDVFYFTPNKKSTAGMNAGSKNDLLLYGLCGVAWLLLLVLAWECWSCWDFMMCIVFLCIPKL